MTKKMSKIARCASNGVAFCRASGAVVLEEATFFSLADNLAYSTIKELRVLMTILAMHICGEAAKHCSITTTILALLYFRIIHDGLSLL